MMGFSTAKQKWQIGLVIFGVVAIIVHFLLKFFDTKFADFPLIFIIVFGSWPLIWQILVKIYHKNFGG